MDSLVVYYQSFASTNTGLAAHFDSSTTSVLLKTSRSFLPTTATQAQTTPCVKAFEFHYLKKITMLPNTNLTVRNAAGFMSDKILKKGSSSTTNVTS